MGAHRNLQRFGYEASSSMASVITSEITVIIFFLSLSFFLIKNLSYFNYIWIDLCCNLVADTIFDEFSTFRTVGLICFYARAEEKSKWLSYHLHCSNQLFVYSS